jgi:hypothetical protein
MISQPVTETKAIIALVVGIALIILAFTIKQFYYARDLSGVSLGRPAPRWFGRVLFSLIGAGFLLFGVSYFLFNH